MEERSYKFSAFKLFYDEFVYKENINVSYLKVKRYIDSIRKRLRDITVSILFKAFVRRKWL